jgi:hypothetical protein
MSFTRACGWMILMEIITRFGEFVGLLSDYEVLHFFTNFSEL